VRVTVLAGFAVLAVASLGLLLIVTATPLWLIAAILAGRSPSAWSSPRCCRRWCRRCGRTSSATPTRCSIRGSGSPGRSVSGWSRPCTLPAVGALGALVLPAARNTAMEHS